MADTEIPTIWELERIAKPDLGLETTTRLAQLIAGVEAGTRLPTERELCERLGVGRSTLREAMGSLAFIGAIETRQGSGTYVGARENMPVGKLIGLGLMLQGSKVEEVIEVRRTLEVETARMAAERHTEQDREELEAIMSRMADSASEPAKAATYDVQFHVLLARATHNTVMMSLINGMRTMLEAWITKAVNREPVVEEIVREHNEVLRSVFQREPDRAAATMYLHLAKATERLFAVVGKDRSTAHYISLLLSR
jgi:GntR family transcriptional regulator, transcriptional repressor for pyruvate dehydrogenase complex